MALNFANFINQNTNFTSEQKQAMLDDFCEQYGYQELIPNGEGGTMPNPTSKVEFFNQKVQAFIKESINAKRKNKARAAASFSPFDFE